MKNRFRSSSYRILLGYWLPLAAILTEIVGAGIVAYFIALSAF